MQNINAQITASVDSLMREFNILTHNLANANTTGYKRRCNQFSKLLDAHENLTNGSSTDVLNNTLFDFSQGNLIHTARSLDLALHSKGFFVIETPQGPLYTRNGAFHINQDRQIVNSQGHPVAGENGPIVVPPNISPAELNISTGGTISGNGIPLGKLRIVDWQNNEKKLLSCGNCCFRMADPNADPEDAEDVVIKQGYKEGSNVQVVEELVDMIMVTRLYEANMKFIGSKKDTTGSLMSVAMG